MVIWSWASVAAVVGPVSGGVPGGETGPRPRVEVSLPMSRAILGEPVAVAYRIVNDTDQELPVQENLAVTHHAISVLVRRGSSEWTRIKPLVPETVYRGPSGRLGAGESTCWFSFSLLVDSSREKLAFPETGGWDIKIGYQSVRLKKGGGWRIGPRIDSDCAAIEIEAAPAGYTKAVQRLFGRSRLYAFLSRDRQATGIESANRTGWRRRLLSRLTELEQIRGMLEPEWPHIAFDLALAWGYAASEGSPMPLNPQRAADVLPRVLENRSLPPCLRDNALCLMAKCHYWMAQPAKCREFLTKVRAIEGTDCMRHVNGLENFGIRIPSNFELYSQIKRDLWIRQHKKDIQGTE